MFGDLCALVYVVFTGPLPVVILPCFCCKKQSRIYLVWLVLASQGLVDLCLGSALFDWLIPCGGSVLDLSSIALVATVLDCSLALVDSIACVTVPGEKYGVCLLGLCLLF